MPSDRQMLIGTDVESHSESCNESTSAAQSRGWRMVALGAVALVAVVGCASLASGGRRAASAATNSVPRSPARASVKEVIIKAEEGGDDAPPCNVMEAGAGSTVEEVEKCAEDLEALLQKELGEDAGDDVVDGYDREDHELTVRFKVAATAEDLTLTDQSVQASIQSLHQAAATVLGDEVSDEFKQNPTSIETIEEEDLLVQVKFTSTEVEDPKKAWAACAAAKDAAAAIKDAIKGPLKNLEVSDVTCEKNPLGW